MSHCPYLLHKFVINYLFDCYSVCLVHSSYRLLYYVSRSFTSPPAPQGCYTYMIATPIWLWLLKWLIYNIAAQPYYCWWTHASYIETIAPRAPLTYLSSEKKTLCSQLCSTRYSAVRINNCSKRTFVIKVATTDDFRNKWKPSRAIGTFRGEQRWMGHKGGPW